MSKLQDTVAAEELIAEDSGNLMGGSGSKPEANWVGLAEVKKGGDGGSACCGSNVGSGDGKRGGERRRINLNADVSVGKWNGERVEDQEHGFRVGDFVWGKIKSHPWWPGQVFDPRDASEFALRHSQEGRLLVAFFGDGSCSWCLPSQLVPFVENLERMWCDKPSRDLVNAVQRAIDEIGRLVESRIICRCIPLEERARLARPVVAHYWVKPGVIVPEVDADRLPIPEYSPAEIRAKLVGYAKTASFDSVFELVVLRSWISAYSYKECGGRLAVYSEPLPIEGLEENSDEKKTAVKVEGPDVDEGIASPSNSLVKLQAPSDDKVFQRRKQKSVSELMAKKMVVKSKKKPKRREGEVGNGLSSDEGSESAQTTDELNENEAAMGWDIGFSSRERKKSKYLSPPYTSLKGRMVDSGSKLNSDLDDLTKVEAMTGGDSRDQELSGGDENEQKATFLASDVDLEVNELLQKMESAAVDRFYLRDEGYLDPVWAFISAYRNATYVRGSDYKTYHKCKNVHHKRKKPSLASPSAPRPRGCSPKVTLPRKRPADEPADDLVSDARAIRQKLDSMTKILETSGSRFSSDDKSSLRGEMKRLMEEVETAGYKVRLMAEKISS